MATRMTGMFPDSDLRTPPAQQQSYLPQNIAWLCKEGSFEFGMDDNGRAFIDETTATGRCRMLLYLVWQDPKVCDGFSEYDFATFVPLVRRTGAASSPTTSSSRPGGASCTTALHSKSSCCEGEALLPARTALGVPREPGRSLVKSNSGLATPQEQSLKFLSDSSLTRPRPQHLSLLVSTASKAAETGVTCCPSTSAQCMDSPVCCQSRWQSFHRRG